VREIIALSERGQKIGGFFRFLYENHGNNFLAGGKDVRRPVQMKVDRRCY